LQLLGQPAMQEKPPAAISEVPGGMLWLPTRLS
jgi:hypothetical protein